MSWIFAVLALTPQHDASTAEPVDDISLFRRVAGESFYAADKFRCRGMRFPAANRAADRALGGDFNQRLGRAGQLLRKHYDPALVDEAGDLVAIGFKITPARCRVVMDIVQRALSDMGELERRLGAK